MLTPLKRRILVIDDDPRLCEVLGRIFEESGRYSVETQTNPLIALAAARGFRPDILIVDILMPGLDGMELAATIRAEPTLADRPIIFYSGALPDGLPEKLQAIGGPSEFWPKSTPASGLVAAVDRLYDAFGCALKSWD